MEYSYLLQDPRWQKKKSEILNRDGWACRRCSDKHMTLHVHHIYYNFDWMPWDYPNEALITLCKLCHEKAHFIRWVMRQGISALRRLGFPPDDIHDVVNLVCRNVAKNGHYESANKYMADIKLLMHG